MRLLYQMSQNFTASIQAALSEGKKDLYHLRSKYFNLKNSVSKLKDATGKRFEEYKNEAKKAREEAKKVREELAIEKVNYQAEIKSLKEQLAGSQEKGDLNDNAVEAMEASGQAEAESYFRECGLE